MMIQKSFVTHCAAISLALLAFSACNSGGSGEGAQSRVRDQRDPQSTHTSALNGIWAATSIECDNKSMPAGAGQPVFTFSNNVLSLQSTLATGCLMTTEYDLSYPDVDSGAFVAFEKPGACAPAHCDPACDQAGRGAVAQTWVFVQAGNHLTLARDVQPGEECGAAARATFHLERR